MNKEDINKVFTYLLNNIIELNERLYNLNERIEALEMVVDQLEKMVE